MSLSDKGPVIYLCARAEKNIMAVLLLWPNAAKELLSHMDALDPGQEKTIYSSLISFYAVSENVSNGTWEKKSLPAKGVHLATKRLAVAAIKADEVSWRASPRGIGPVVSPSIGRERLEEIAYHWLERLAALPQEED